MKIYTEKGYALPLINSNGNDPKELIKQIQSVYKSVEDARNELYKLDMYDGRNSADPIHNKVLKNDRSGHGERLNQVMVYLSSVLIGINKQIRDNRK